MGELDEFEDEFGEESPPSAAKSTKQRLAGLAYAKRGNSHNGTKSKAEFQLSNEKGWQTRRGRP